MNELYVGVESGLDDVLTFINKGNTVDDVRRQCARLNSIGMRHMAMLMPGAAHSLDSVRIAGFIGKSRQAMLDRLQHAIDHMDEELFNKTFRRDHL